MPVLENPRYEAFVQARAKGVLLIDAYESAGFVRHWGHPSRLALKAEVADRIAELRALKTDIEDTSPLGLLASLRRIIKAGEASENPTLVNAARLAIVDASRIQAELAGQQAQDRAHLTHEFNKLSAAELAEMEPKGEAERPSPPRELPVAAPPAPRERPEISHRAPRNLLASAVAPPRALPGLSSAAPRRLESRPIFR